MPKRPYFTYHTITVLGLYSGIHIIPDVTVQSNQQPGLESLAALPGCPFTTAIRPIQAARAVWR